MSVALSLPTSVMALLKLQTTSRSSAAPPMSDGGFGLGLRFENGLQRSEDQKGLVESQRSHLGIAGPDGGVAGLVFVSRRGWREVSIQPNAEKTKKKEMREREREFLGAMSESSMGLTK